VRWVTTEERRSKYIHVTFFMILLLALLVLEEFESRKKGDFDKWWFLVSNQWLLAR
jgi:hypothetical protein